LRIRAGVERWFDCSILHGHFLAFPAAGDSNAPRGGFASACALNIEKHMFLAPNR
jgi:hypothetical protein